MEEVAVWDGGEGPLIEYNSAQVIRTHGKPNAQFPKDIDITYGMFPSLPLEIGCIRPNRERLFSQSALLRRPLQAK